MDKLIHLFRKARPESSIDIQDEEVKNHLLAGLPSNVINVVEGYLDLSAADIALKYDIIASQREALVHWLKQLVRNRQNRFKDETCTYCNKKGHTETVCFAKRDDDKMNRLAEKVSAAMAQSI